MLPPAHVMIGLDGVVRKGVIKEKGGHLCGFYELGQRRRGFQFFLFMLFWFLPGGEHNGTEFSTG